MKLNKFDRIQLLFNILLITATILNILYFMSILPQWCTLLGFGLAIAGCVITNLAATGEGKGVRTEVSGNKVLAGLTYVTGVLWVITYGLTIFFRIDFGG